MINKKNWLFAIIGAISIIMVSIVIVVFFRQLFYVDIKYLDLEAATGLSYEQLKNNYDVLINYQSILYSGELVLPNFVMSQNGKIHFEEVKNIFVVIQILAAVGIIYLLSMFYIKYKSKDFQYFKTTAIATVLIPCMVGLMVSVDFSKAFVLFHRIMFRNDYWIFDERLDPVITMLPEAFFMHCFILIVLIVLLICSLHWFTYKKLLAKYQTLI